MTNVLDTLGPLGVDRRYFLYCETYLVHDSSVTSFTDGGSAQAVTGGVDESSWWRRGRRASGVEPSLCFSALSQIGSSLGSLENWGTANLNHSAPSSSFPFYIGAAQRGAHLPAKGQEHPRSGCVRGVWLSRWTGSDEINLTFSPLISLCTLNLSLYFLFTSFALGLISLQIST